MFIAFEGPDNTGKSTSAANLATDKVALYNATKPMHEHVREDYATWHDVEPDTIVTYDRIDWFSHMVYRLALPDREWNDERPRTVFAMPDTHLVIFTHHPQLAEFTAEEVVDTPIGKVNPMYFYFGDFLLKLNRQLGFSLFKSVSMIEVANDADKGIYTWKPYAFSSRIGDLFDNAEHASQVTDPDSLLLFLQYVDHVS